MENNGTKTGSTAPKTGQAAQGTGTMGSEIRDEARGLADRATDAAKELSEHAAWALDDLKAAGQGVVDEYAGRVSRRKQQIQDAARRATEYADQNTALVAGGALLVGVLLGHILTRKGDRA